MSLHIYAGLTSESNASKLVFCRQRQSLMPAYGEGHYPVAGISDSVAYTDVGKGREQDAEALPAIRSLVITLTYWHCL